MKKKYIIPQVLVVMIKVQPLLAGSGPDANSQVNPGFSGSRALLFDNDEEDLWEDN
jgi:hypothetical protein